MRYPAPSAVLIALTGAASGCGNERPVEVVAPRTVEARDLARYPADSPQRSALELLRAVQFNDPTAVAHYLDPSFGLSHAAVAKSLDYLRGTALALGVPRRLTVTKRTPSAASLVFRVGPDRITVRLVRGPARWRLTAIGTTSARLAQDITNLIFFAQHPEVGVRKLRPGEGALIADWLAVRTRVRRVAR